MKTSRPFTPRASAPNVEEQLTSAAFTILTDDQPHDHRALAWAARFMRAAAKGRETAFQHRADARAFGEGARG